MTAHVLYPPSTRFDEQFDRVLRLAPRRTFRAIEEIGRDNRVL